MEQKIVPNGTGEKGTLEKKRGCAKWNKKLCQMEQKKREA